MQLTNILTILALTAVGAVAAPSPVAWHPAPPPPPPKPAPPVINHQVNYCSSGSPYCCSPTNSDKSGGTTCKLSTTQCNTVSICCNNAQNGGGSAVSTSVSSMFLQRSSSALNHNMRQPYQIQSFATGCTLVSVTATTIVSGSSMPLNTANSSPQPFSPSLAAQPIPSNSPSTSKATSVKMVSGTLAVLSVCTTSLLQSLVL